jgi:hypothetical protein
VCGVVVEEAPREAEVVDSNPTRSAQRTIFARKIARLGVLPLIKIFLLLFIFGFFRELFCTGGSLSTGGSQATACGIGPFLLASSAGGVGKRQ